MQNNNTTAINTTIILVNGFERSMSVLSWDGSSFDVIAACGEFTWHDDQKVDREVTLLGKGAVVRHRRYTSDVELLGFTAEELAAPAPFSFWKTTGVAFRAWETRLATTMGDWLESLAMREEPMPLTDGIHDLPYCWGDQPARHLALVVGGKVVDQLKGCGDRTPETWGEEADCIREKTLMPNGLLRRLSAAEKAAQEAERRHAQWMAFKERYRGTRLYKAARAAGFGDMIPSGQ
jgi:hypothetical protein